MSRKTLRVQIMLFFTLVLIGAEVSAERRAYPEPSASPAITQGTCTDAAIKAAVIEEIKKKFPLNKRVIMVAGKKQSRFHFIVSSSNKVVTLKGWVPGETLRKQILDQVQKTIQDLNCGVTLNPDVLDSKKGVFRNNKPGSCPEGQVECSNGECKASVAACSESPFDN